MNHQLRFAARSDRGLLRSNNQDSVYAGERLMIVADGMGGHAAGDLASRVVVAAFAPLDAEPPLDLLGALRQALLDGNEAIAEMVADDPDLDGMGTTATALLFDGDRVGLAHIGDSRAYLYRNGVLHQLSHDDTFVQSLVDDGRITEDEATHHPQRNLLLRALNGTAPEPSITEREMSLGDRFLLCSDGLSGVVAAEAIADALADPEPDSSADRLIELALVAGGPDNVTVIVADVIDVGTRSTPGVPAEPFDPDATGPIRPIHETQRMPRVPLPAIDDEPTDPRARPGRGDGAGHPGEAGTFGDDDSDYDDLTGGEPPTDRQRRRHRTRWHRRGALTLAVVVLLGVIAGGTLIWARTNYYVGADDGRVVVFRGVNGSVLGIALSSVEEDSCAGSVADCTPIAVDDLQPAFRDQVRSGIEVADLRQAREVIARLSGRMLPLCDTVTDDQPSVVITPTTTEPSATAPPTTGSSAGSGSSTGTSGPTKGSTARTGTATTGATGAKKPTGTAASGSRTTSGTAAASDARATTPRRTVGPPPPRLHRTNRLHDAAALLPQAAPTTGATATAASGAPATPDCREPG